MPADRLSVVLMAFDLPLWGNLWLVAVCADLSCSSIWVSGCMISGGGNRATRKRRLCHDPSQHSEGPERAELTRCPVKHRKESAKQKRHRMRCFHAIYGEVIAHSDGSLHPIMNPITLTNGINRALKARGLVIRIIRRTSQAQGEVILL